MAYTLGANAADDINWASQVTLGANARIGLIAGWWLPTTLTATRKLWSVNTTGICGAEIDATTSELRLRTDNTTDGQWTTTGAALAVDKWSFFAFALSTLNGTPAAAWRVWMGTANTAPTEITVAEAVAPVGNFGGSASVYVGNAGTGTLAFQGDIAHVSYYICSSSATAVTNPFGIAAHGAITQTEADFIAQRYVWPLWLGQGWRPDGACRTDGQLTAVNEDCGYCTLDLLPQVVCKTNSNASPGALIPTINNATWSQNGPPRPLVGRIIEPTSAPRR